MNLEKYEVGFNIPASIGMDIKDIQTPALVIDLKVFQSNILKMKILFLKIMLSLDLMLKCINQSMLQIIKSTLVVLMVFVVKKLVKQKSL